MTRIKICGVKRLDTLQLLTELGVDYIGFIFAESRRRVSPEHAGRLLGSVEGHPPAVGVFVNPSWEELEEAVGSVPLAVIQLHGDETAEFCRQVRERFSLPVWKAIAVADEAAVPALIRGYAGAADAFLFDTYDPMLPGGTGRRFSWNHIPLLRQHAAGAGCIIAGGINETNVGELLATYRPEMIDISSGVETDGEKDGEKIIRFVQRVREYDLTDDRQRAG
jgi:phosphoribosylanthranilate isomerase